MPSTHHNHPDRRKDTQKAYLILPESELSDEEISDIVETFSTNFELDINTYDNTLPEQTEATRGRCPHCGSNDIRSLRGKEETWSVQEDSEWIYEGPAHETTVLQSETIIAWCGECDAQLYQHPVEPLLKIDTL